MSYFLCLALPKEAVPKLGKAFDQSITLTDASNFPIGVATRGKNKHWATYLLQIGFDSHTLVAVGLRKKTHNNDHRGLLISGIEALLSDEACPSVSILLHLMHGLISTEAIVIRHEEEVKLSAITETIKSIKEDVIYSVSE